MLNFKSIHLDESGIHDIQPNRRSRIQFFNLKRLNSQIFMNVKSPTNFIIFIMIICNYFYHIVNITFFVVTLTCYGAL